jgi:hypothetical protein
LLLPVAIDHAFRLEEGFHRADWRVIDDWIESKVNPEDRAEAWSEAALLWVSMLRDDLGSSYYVLQSETTILLADLPTETAQWLLRYAGSVASKLQSELKDLAWAGASSKDVLLVFLDLDDYDQYLAFHSKEGIQPASAGVCIHSGYTHIAIPWHDEREAANAVAHELTHDCLAHLQLPLWLNEGVALTLQRAIAPPPVPLGQSRQDMLFSAAIDWRPPLIWDELAERHFAFWNERNIQDFWAGTLFHQPGDPNELSYSLSEVLVKLLSEKGSVLADFLRHARPEDGGLAAAFEVMDADLGAVAGTFLGPGDWRPRRMAIKESWKAAGWTDPLASDEHAN